MYERFSDRARKAMQMANQAAQKWNHEYIGTEHILLGLVKEGSGNGAGILTGLGLKLTDVTTKVEGMMRPGPEMITMGKLPQTPRGKKVIEQAIVAARELACNYVGTEHLLVGLVRETEGIAAVVLAAMGATRERVEAAVRDLRNQLLWCAYDEAKPAVLRCQCGFGVAADYPLLQPTAWTLLGGKRQSVGWECTIEWANDAEHVLAEWMK